MSLNLAMNFAGTAPAALQWTLSHAAANFTSVVVTAGPAATAAGKGITCAPYGGGTTCILAGVNTNTISNGVVAVATFQAAGTASGSIPIPVTGIVSARMDGTALPSSGAGGTITVPSAVPAPGPGPTPPVTVSQLSCTPGSVTGPGQVSCTVGLNTTATSATTVALSSNHQAIAVPAFIIVAAGSSSGIFNAAAATVQTNTTARITATVNGTSAGTDIAVLAALPPAPAPTPVTVSQLSCAPGSITGPGQVSCTVSLNTTPTSATTVALSSNQAALAVPSAVTVAAGSNSGTFNAAAATVQTNTTARVTATVNGTSAGTDIAVLAALPPAPAPTPPVTVSQLSCVPGSITGPGLVACTVRLSITAASSTTVALFSNHAALVVPTSVTVAAGSNSVEFNVATAPVQANTTTRATANLNGTSAWADVTVLAPAPAPTPPVTVSQLSCLPGSITGPGQVSCTVGVSTTPTSATTVALSSNHAALAVPSAVTVAAGSNSATFNATASSVQTNTTARVTATVNGTSMDTDITVVAAASAPSTPPILSFLTCTPTVVMGLDSTSTCIAGLDKAAVSPVVVTITNFGALVPSSVIVAAGRTSVSFTLRRDAGLSSDYAIVAARAGGAQRAVFITFVAAFSFSICNPDSLTTPGGAQCTVEADQHISPLPWIDRVVNIAAGSEAACSPGSILSILGSGLTSGSIQGEPSARVLINGEEAAVLAASAGRLTFACPSIRLAPELTIVVANEHGFSGAVSIPMREAAPSIFMMDDIRPGQGMIVVRETGQIASLLSEAVQAAPARPGDLVSLFATGLGAVPLENGEFVDNSELRSRIQLLIDGFPAEVTFVGAVAGLPGVYQVDAGIPGAVTRGEVTVEIRTALIDGQVASSNRATIIVEDQHR